MLKKKLEQIFKVGALVGLLASIPFAASVAPFYFDGVDESLQEDYWKDLMRYKLWGTRGIEFPLNTVHISEKSGYTGTADGDMLISDNLHTLGGPILIGGNVAYGNGGSGIDDYVFEGGPARFLGSVTIPNWSWNSGEHRSVFDGPYCIEGDVKTIGSLQYDNSVTKWMDLVQGGVYSAATGAAGTYNACPASVPLVDTHLTVPLRPAYTGTWAPAINMTSGDDVEELNYIQVPPRQGGDPETADLYIESISMRNSIDKKLYVLMPPGGRLTRIFLNTGLHIDESANKANIGVMYVNDGATWNGTSWDGFDPALSTIISNDDYAGNLMFYSTNEIFIDYLKEGRLQGSYITTKSLVFRGHMKFAGQLIANQLELTHNITGDFRYVPFDPPILNIDPTAYAGGVFTESNVDQKIPISLDIAPETAVYFDYCFVIDTTETPEVGSTLARAEDFNPMLNGQIMPICGHDTSTVSISAGSKEPTGLNAAYIHPWVDGIAEPTESFVMKIFNLSGAVLPGNKKSGSFVLKIADSDFNPVAKDASVTGLEDIVLELDESLFPFTSPENEPLLSISIITLPAAGTLSLDGVAVVVDQEVLLADISNLRFLGEPDSSGSPYTSFKFSIRTESGWSHNPGTLTINLLPVNDPPVLSATLSFEVYENSPVGTLVGTVVAVDPDAGSIFTYTLVPGGDGDAVFTVQEDGRITVKTATLNYEQKNQYQITVMATDNGLEGVGDFLTATTLVTINVLDVNEAPVLGAKAFSLNENNANNATVGTITGTDVDANTVLTYSMTGVNSNLFRINASTGEITTASGIVFDYETMAHTYTLTVTVKDNGLDGVGASLSTSATVTINLIDVNEAPVLGAKTFSFAENNANNATVGTITGTDVDANTVLTYSMTGVNSNLFRINASTGEITTAPGVIFDYETMAHTYTLTVTVKDNGLNGVGTSLSTSATVTINLIDVNEAPVLANATWSLNENNANKATVGTITGTDVDANTVLTYSMTGVNSDLFTINASTGEIKTAPDIIFDYETMAHTYTLTVTVKDNGLNGVGASLSTSATVTINVLDVNEAPVLGAKTFSFAENNANDATVGTITGTDVDANTVLTYSMTGVNSDLFTINASTGEIKTAPDIIFDYETMAHTYTLTVTVKDNGLNGVGASLSTSATVTINVLDVNEAPVLGAKTFSFAENNANDATVGTITGTDVDANTVLTYSMTGVNSNLFRINASTGEITTASGIIFDYETMAHTYTLTVTVKDNGLNGVGASLSTSATVTINLIDVNEAPVLGAKTFSLNENNANNATVGTITGTDGDANTVLTYSMTGVNSDLFRINASTGEITTAPGIVFDYETMAHTYTLTVTVKDNGLNGVGTSLSTSATVTINLIDVNEAPVIANQSFDVFENSSAGTFIGTVIATDPEGDPLTYTVLSGNEENLFVMDANGKITVRASNSLDYDTMDSIYTLKVMVSDPSGLESTATIYINLKNVNEPPVWNDAILEVSENEPVSTSVGVVSAVDEDRYDTLIYKIVGGSGEDLFEVNPNTGRVTTKIVFDYEDINSYTIDIEVSDGEFKLVKTFTVSILDVNEPPVIDDSNVDIDENVPRGTVVTTVTATDVDSPVLDYTIVQDQDGKKFRVDPNGVITVDGDLDYEEQKTYKVRVVVTDGFSNDTALVTISINDLNEAPTIPNAKFYVAENATSAVKIGSVKYTDPENDVLVFVVLADTSGKFKITSSGDVYLKAGASLDYESVTSYTIKVIGTDPGGLSDTANVEIVVTNVIETAEVKIITAITKDSIYPNPDTLYINTLYIDLEWTEDGDRNFGDTILVDGYNIIIKEFCVEHKDFCGYDTLIVYVNTKTPGVVLYPEGYDPAKVSGITIVEQKKKGDSAFYVNRNENQILVTVTDPGIDGKPVITDFKISADLQTVKVPASVFETLGKVADAWRFETSEDLTYSSVNEEQKASYETTVKGAAITVSYDLHKDSTTAQISYLTVINGKDVIVSYVADRRTGKLIKDAATDAVYSVGYTYVDKKKNEIFVSYSVDSKGQIIKDPKDDSILYHLTYDYTNKYGNTAKKTIDIVLDKLPPVVQIISPVNGVTVSSVSLDVRWTVDGIEQDTLNLQSLNKGINLIIRAYRDKAGNETADTVMIMMKNAKDIVVSMQEPLIEMTDKKREKFQRDDPPAKDDRFGVSILNVNTNTEEEVLIGKASGSTVKGSGEEPYPGLSGSHLGPTLEIDAKLPSLTAFGGLASLDDLIEADGMIAIEAGGGWDRTRVTVSDYVSKYCSEEFKEKFDFSDPSATPLYKINFGMSIWIYSSLGSFIDLYKFSPELQSQDYVNAAGVVKMYFELKPGVDGHLRDHKDRLLATSAYLFKTEIKMTFTQQCTLPDQTPVGTKKVVKEDFLSSFGFKRPQ